MLLLRSPYHDCSGSYDYPLEEGCYYWYQRTIINPLSLHRSFDVVSSQWPTSPRDSRNSNPYNNSAPAQKNAQARHENHMRRKTHGRDPPGSVIAVSGFANLNGRLVAQTERQILKPITTKCVQLQIRESPHKNGVFPGANERMRNAPI